mgnify:CR=1 FL=1
MVTKFQAPPEEKQKSRPLRGDGSWTSGRVSPEAREVFQRGLVDVYDVAAQRVADGAMPVVFDARQVLNLHD